MSTWPMDWSSSTKMVEELRHYARQVVHELRATGLPGPNVSISVRMEDGGDIAISVGSQTLVPDWRAGVEDLLDLYLAGARRMAWALGCGHPVFRIGTRGPQRLRRRLDVQLMDRGPVVRT